MFFKKEFFGYILYKVTPSPNVEQKQSVILHTEPKIALEVLQQMPDGSWGDLDHKCASFINKSVLVNLSGVLSFLRSQIIIPLQ